MESSLAVVLSALHLKLGLVSLVVVVVIILLSLKCSLAFGNLVLITIAKKFMEV